MKPYKLTLSGFGSFSELTEIDFGRMRHTSGVFLLCGATGAGKTTILDAMSYALFGESSGNERQHKVLRSDFLPPDAKAFVRFEFFFGHRLFRVERELPRTSKTGASTVAEKAELMELDATTGAETVAIASKSNAVSAAVANILGLSARQFREMIIIPQGKFREILTAKAKEREEALRALFDIQLHADFEKTLGEMAKEATAEVEKNDQMLRAIVQGAGVASVHEVEFRLHELQRLQAELGEQEAEAVRRRDAAEEALRAAERVNALAREDAQLQEWLHNHSLGEPEREQTRKEIERFKQLRSHSDLFLRLRRAEQEVQAATQELERASEQKRRSAAEVERAQKMLQALQEQQRAVDEMSARLEVLRDDKPRLAERDRLAAEEVRYLNTAASLGQEQAQLRQQLLKAADEVEALTKKKTPPEILQGRRDEVSAAMERVTNQGRLAADIDRQSRRAGELQSNKAAAEAALANALGREEECLQRYKRAEALWRSGNAYTLAKDLQPQTPCPVCGSAEHPAPAAPPAEYASTEQVDAAKDEYAKAMEASAEVRVTLTALATELKSVRADIEEWTKQLSPELSAEVGALRSEYAALQAQKKSVEEALAEQSRIDAAIEEARTLREQLQRRAEVKETEYKACQDRLGEVRLHLHTVETVSGLTSSAALEEEQQSISQRLADHHKQAEAAREQLRLAQMEGARAEAVLLEAQRRHREQETLCMQLHEAAREQAHAVGARDIEHAVQILSEVTRFEALEQSLQREHDVAEQKQQRRQEIRRELDGAMPADPEPLQQSRQEARDHLDKINRERGRLAGDADQAATALQRARKVEHQQRAAAARADRLTGLYKILSGSNSKNLRFSQYIVAAFLDRVLVFANQRLKTISKDQYELRRTAEVIDKRTTDALRLMVFDAMTGLERPVETLSGGESFYVALSLALGLADVAQQETGARHFECLFIDEGFGSLDPETLDRALETLQTDIASDRLIGLISHVGEMRERIPLWLEVRKNNSGSSSAAWVEH